MSLPAHLISPANLITSTGSLQGGQSPLPRLLPTHLIGSNRRKTRAVALWTLKLAHYQRIRLPSLQQTLFCEFELKKYTLAMMFVDLLHFDHPEMPLLD